MVNSPESRQEKRREEGIDLLGGKPGAERKTDTKE
jgi:hypothetical protein